MSFSFLCKCCDQVHEGIPTFGADAPAIYYWIGEDEREKRVVLDTDTCIIDAERFLIRGCIEIRVEGESDPFIWGAWVDVSQKDFETFRSVLGVKNRKHVGPFAGYLGSTLPTYTDSTFNLHVVAYLRDDGVRPFVEVSPSAHALHKEQCQGITSSRVVEIYEHVMHGK
jgi:hypothetical protein